MPAGKIVLVKKAKRTYKKRAPKATQALVPAKTSTAKSTTNTKINLLRNYIKAVVGKQAEIKKAYTSTGNSLVKFNAGIDSVGDLNKILPNISQGVAENERIGNQIRAKSLNIRGYMKLDINDVADSTTLTHVVVRMMVVTFKVAPSWQDAQTLSSKIGTLLKKGGTTSAFAGNIQDLYADINTDVFTVHYDKKFYLKQDYVNVAGASAPSTTIAQDTSKTVKFFNINVKCKNKLLRYDQSVNSDVMPTNFAPILLMGYSYLDGSSPDVVNTKVGLCYDAQFNYTDA